MRLGRRAWVGLGSRVFDSDQHDYDAEHREQIAPVEIGDYTWVAADVTILKGVRIGSHCIVGTRSLVTRDVPDHSLAFGIARRSCAGRSATAARPVSSTPNRSREPRGWLFGFEGRESTPAFASVE